MPDRVTCTLAYPFQSALSLASARLADKQECTALHLGLRPLSRAYQQLSQKVKSEEEDLQRLADIWGSYRPIDGRPSNLRAGALRDFRKGCVLSSYIFLLIYLPPHK